MLSRALGNGLSVRPLAPRRSQCAVAITHALTDARLRLAFMGTPDFAVPALAALVGGRPRRSPRSIPSRRGRPAAARSRAVARCSARPSGWPAGAHADEPARRRRSRRRSRRSALDAAVVAAYGLILPQPMLDAPRLRLPQHPRLAAAALARCGADPARDPGRRRRDRRHHHADGRRPRHRPDAAARGGADRRRRHRRRRLHDGLAALGARLIVRGARRARRRHAAAAPQPDEGVTYAAKIDTRRGAARLARSRRPRSSASVRAFDPWPGAWFDARRRAHPGAGAPSRRAGARAPARHGAATTRLTVACGDGALRLAAAAARRAGARMAADAFLRGLRAAARHAASAMPPHAPLQAPLEYDGAPFVGWQRQANGPSVQEALEDAAFELLRRAVPASPPAAPMPACTPLGQVAHLDLARRRRPATRCATRSIST